MCTSNLYVGAPVWNLYSFISHAVAHHRTQDREDVNACQITLFAFGERNIDGETGGGEENHREAEWKDE